jgi:GMP synthase-like glutamine amidotransferase
VKALTIGILLTDHVVPELRHDHGDQTDFYDYIFNLADPTVKLRVYDVVLDEYPEFIDECDGYLITGSKLSVYDAEDWIRKLEIYVQLLNKQKKALLGVCFGHQLIAKALGGKSEEASIGWNLGIQNYDFQDTFPWVQDQSQSVSLIHSHKDQVTELPKTAELIASNTRVPIAMFKIGDHVMSMQGHPEFTPEYAHAVATMRKEVLGKEVYQQASISLKNQIANNVEVAKWWVDFFRFNN